MQSGGAQALLSPLAVLATLGLVLLAPLAEIGARRFHAGDLVASFFRGCRGLLRAQGEA